MIADGDFSEEPEKLGLNLHGDPCISAGLSSQGRLRPISLFNSDRMKSSIRGDLPWDSFLLNRQSKDGQSTYDFSITLGAGTQNRTRHSACPLSIGIACFVLSETR